jgi:hypothetical protein
MVPARARRAAVSACLSILKGETSASRRRPTARMYVVVVVPCSSSRSSRFTWRRRLLLLLRWFSRDKWTRDGYQPFVGRRDRPATDERGLYMCT